MLYYIGNFILFVYSLTILASVLIFNYYSILGNATNHSGIPLNVLLILYLVTLLITLVIIFIGWKSHNHSKIAFFLLAALAMISLLGFINIIAYEQLNIMMSYEAWLHKGMPDKPSFFR